jgi:hypothetical protein
MTFRHRDPREANGTAAAGKPHKAYQSRGTGAYRTAHGSKRDRVTDEASFQPSERFQSIRNFIFGAKVSHASGTDVRFRRN